MCPAAPQFFPVSFIFPSLPSIHLANILVPYSLHKTCSPFLFRDSDVQRRPSRQPRRACPTQSSVQHCCCVSLAYHRLPGSLCGVPFPKMSAVALPGNVALITTVSPHCGSMTPIRLKADCLSSIPAALDSQPSTPGGPPPDSPPPLSERVARSRSRSRHGM